MSGGQKSGVSTCLASIGFKHARRACHHSILACMHCSLQAAQAALDVRNARYKSALMRQSSDDDDASDASERVKERLEQAERAVEKFVSRRLKAVQPGLEKVPSPVFICKSVLWECHLMSFTYKGVI